MTSVIQCPAIKFSEDRYGGIIIDEASLPSIREDFEVGLRKIIAEQHDKKVMWITLPIGKAEYIPLLTTYEFSFYDCTETNITLFKRLVANPSTPTATNHTVGVGAFVRDGDDILVIKDRIYQTFKLPGGYIDHKENISQALTREVAEETGIKVNLESVVSMGHFSSGQFDESNVYIVCTATPLSKDINISDSHEIIAAKWVNIDEYLNSEETHAYNKKIVETARRNAGLKFEESDLFASQNSQYEFFF